MILQMKVRAYIDNINDIRHLSSEDTQLSEETKTQLNKFADNLESDLKEIRFIVIILVILFVGCVSMWFLSSLENDNLKSDLDNKKSLIESYEKIIRFENDSTRSFTYKTKGGKPITYQELMDENYTLLNRVSELEDEIRERDMYLDLIRRQYGINIVHQNGNYWAEGARVDSALLLLDLYRDKIEYKPKEKVWSVTR